MKLSEISIQNPVFAWMLMASTIIFGSIGFNRLGVSQMPDADFPVLNISVALEGAAPEVIESSIIDPLENSMMGVEGVRQISSLSKAGSGSVTLEFDLEKDINVALQEVQAKAAQVIRRLPKEAEAPVITKTNPDDQPILWLALSSKNANRLALMKFARDYLQDRFTTIEGVGDLFLGGYTEPNIRIWVHQQVMKAKNISIVDIIEALRSEHIEIAGGMITHGQQNINIRTMGEASTLAELGKIVISRRGGIMGADPSQVVRLDDLATIEEGLDDIKRISRFNGEPAIGLGIRKQRGSNAVAVAKAVKSKVVEINKTLPQGMELKVNFDSTIFIESAMRELNKHLVLAALLTTIVCFLFLGSWSATFNVLLSIPTSIMGTFLVLYFCGFTLNVFTLLGLTLSIGIVVDDAIMVLENIFRYFEKGMNRVEASIFGAKEISFAALAATMAVIAIFLPVAFMKGAIGKYFMQFGVTISVAVFLSLIEALTITPMRCSQFVKHDSKGTRLGLFLEKGWHYIESTYKGSLKRSLTHPYWVMGVALLFVILSALLLRKMPMEMTPAQDQSIFMVRILGPVGTNLTTTNEKVKVIEDWVFNQPEIQQAYFSIGGFSGGSSDTHTAMAFITLKPKGLRGIRGGRFTEFSQNEFMDFMRSELKKITKMKIILQDFSMRGLSSGRGFPIEFVLQGPDWGVLWEYAQKIMKSMENKELFVDIDSNYLLGQPELKIIPDRQAAGLRGVTINQIGSTVSALVGGIKVGQFNLGGHRYDMRLKVEESAMNSPEDLIPDLMVTNARGNLIPLKYLATQKLEPSLQQISRIDRQRALTITAGLKTGVSQEKGLQMVDELIKETLSEPYWYKQTGSTRAMRESFSGLTFAMFLGILVAYMVLASQFNSYLDPIVILLTLPLSLGGAALALYFTGQSLNIYSFIGLLLLMGIVKKNSILLVDFTNGILKTKGVSIQEALLQACPVRLRPILMTSFATVAAAIPSALATGEGSETTRPMAWTIVGGVFVSTLLTLYVVPSAYQLLTKFKKK